MKKNLLLLVVIFSHQLIFAAHVDINTARNTAHNFYFSIFNINASDKDAPVITNSADYFTENKLSYYFINFSDKGFVIVSADDEFYPVVGYSDEANLDPANIPSAMRWWLDKQAAETEKASIKGSEYSKSISGAWKKYSGETIVKSNPKVVIAPLLTCKWNQDAGYNFHCPAYSSGPGGHCYAGCVATAMSQIMYYFKYPEHGYGSHSYSHVFYGTITENFAETTYNWGVMTNSLTNGSKDAISTLIYHCGVSVDMNYTPLSSGANSESVAEAMISHFNYSNRLKYLEKSDYGNEEWNQMLIDNLEMQQPVYYSGSGAEGGHAFVCDGVKDSCYFHFNWGWSGYGNGYFYISNLNSGNGNFSGGQAAVMNIAPYFYPYCMGEKTFTEGYKTFHDGSNNSYYWNDTDCEWLIAPDTAQKISLLFNYFATEKDHDILSIYDGEDASAPLIGQYSGHDSPPLITSTGNRLYLRFSTDGSNQDLGWSVTYSTATAGINENDDNNKLKIFPNPASDRIAINLPSDLTEPLITFYNLTGESFTFPLASTGAKEISLNIDNFSSGFYVVKLVGLNKTYVGKLLIQR